MAATHSPRLVDWSEELVCICGKERCEVLMKPKAPCFACERPGDYELPVDGATVWVCEECWGDIE